MRPVRCARNPDSPSGAVHRRAGAREPQTTIKLTTETRDRLRDLGGDTYEDTIIEALDLLEEREFW